MTDVEYDLNNICRTCLTYSTDLQSIFEICVSTTLPVQLDSIIMSVTKVEVRESPVLGCSTVSLFSTYHTIF